MTDISRRNWIISTLAGGAALLVSPSLLAAEKAAASDELNKLLAGVKDVSGTDKILLDVPVYAESTMSVPVGVVSNIPGTRSIDILVSKDSPIAAASFTFKNNAMPKVATRVQIADTTDIIAVVTTDSGRYSAMVDVLSQSTDGCFGSKLDKKK